MLKRFSIFLSNCFNLKCTGKYIKACEAIEKAKIKINEIDVNSFSHQKEPKVMNF